MEDKVIGGRLQQLELVSSESFYNENPEWLYSNRNLHGIQFFYFYFHYGQTYINCNKRQIWTLLSFPKTREHEYFLNGQINWQ